jgi:hypothetical protein
VSTRPIGHPTRGVPPEPALRQNRLLSTQTLALAPCVCAAESRVGQADGNADMQCGPPELSGSCKRRRSLMRRALPHSEKHQVSTRVCELGAPRFGWREVCCAGPTSQLPPSTVCVHGSRECTALLLCPPWAMRSCLYGAGFEGRGRVREGQGEGAHDVGHASFTSFTVFAAVVPRPTVAARVMKGNREWGMGVGSEGQRERESAAR